MIKKKKHNCPFCSSNKIKIVIDKEYPGRMLMGLCTNCRCCGGHGDTVSKTIDSWNSYVEEVWKARKEDKKNNFYQNSSFTSFSQQAKPVLSAGAAQIRALAQGSCHE